MKKLLIFFLLFLTACGAWTADYEQSQNGSLEASIDPKFKRELISALKKLGRQNNFRVVVQEKDEHAKNAFNIIMKRKDVAVICTNLPRTTVLKCSFHIHQNSDVALSENELGTLIDVFSIGVDKVEGITIREVVG